jgi:hypothetical protein
LNLANLVPSTGQHNDRNALVARTYHSQQFESLDVGEPEIENDQIRLSRQQIKGCFAVRCFQDFIALRAQSHSQQLANGRLVIDHQDFEWSSVHAAVSSCSVWGGIGSLIANTAPERSVRFAAVMVPCMASTKPREIARPRPVPART